MTLRYLGNNRGSLSETGTLKADRGTQTRVSAAELRPAPCALPTARSHPAAPGAPCSAPASSLAVARCFPLPASPASPSPQVHAVTPPHLRARHPAPWPDPTSACAVTLCVKAAWRLASASAPASAARTPAAPRGPHRVCALQGPRCRPVPRHRRLPRLCTSLLDPAFGPRTGPSSQVAPAASPAGRIHSSSRHWRLGVVSVFGKMASQVTKLFHFLTYNSKFIDLTIFHVLIDVILLIGIRITPALGSGSKPVWTRSASCPGATAAPGSPVGFLPPT